MHVPNYLNNTRKRKSSLALVRNGEATYWWATWGVSVIWLLWLLVKVFQLSIGEVVVWQSGSSTHCQRPTSHRPAPPTWWTASEPLCQDVLSARPKVQYACTMYGFVFPFNTLWNYLNLVHHITPAQNVFLLCSPCGCIVFLAIRVKDGPKQWRKALSPSGTKLLYIPMSTDGTSESACWRSRCGISPGSKRRRVNSWARSETNPFYTNTDPFYRIDL